jgi:hypothetical protein
MKRSLLLFLLLSFSLPCFTQIKGVSGSLVLIIPEYDNWAHDFHEINNRFYMHHENRYCTGARVEYNYMRDDGDRIYPFFADYFGAGISYIFPFKDSASYVLQTTQGYPFEVNKAEVKNDMLNLGMHFGYKIPQEFNDFLSIFLGAGGGVLTSRATYPLPPPHGTYTYTREEFKPESFHSVRKFTANMEAFVLLNYEFERFSVMGQYSFLYSFTEARTNDSGLLDSHIRSQVTLGIFYPLKKS